MKKLSEVIKELEDKGAIDYFFLHHEYWEGNLELNITFNNEKADEILNSSGFFVSRGCACWE